MKNYLDKFLLKNKTAFITGGLGLLGSETAKALSDAGAKVIILDIDKSKAKKLLKKNQNLFFEEFNITEVENLDEKIDSLKKKFKKIDIWVNCAYPRTPDWGSKVEDLKLESWQKNIDAHLNSYSWISKKVCQIMKTQKGGSLINFGSIYGVVGNDFSIYKGTNLTSPMAYSAIKGGITNLGRYLSSYFGEHDVRINTICPGGIFDNQNPAFVKNYNSRVPLKRMGRPEEIASAVLFLASDASSYITGTAFMVDGGWTAI